MLEKEFQNIEYQINYFLCKFFTEINNKITINESLSDKDTPQLLRIFTKKYEQIQKIMNWPNKEFMDIAYLIIMLRNKYYHRNQLQNITENDEIFDLLCIMKFMKSFNEIFKGNDSYNEFISQLDKLNIKMKNNCKVIEKEEDKLESVTKKIDILFSNYDNIKTLIEKQDGSINNIINEYLNKEDKKITKKDNHNEGKKKKIVVKSRNNDNTQAFSSEDISLFNEIGKIIDEDKNEKTTIEINTSKTGLTKEILNQRFNMDKNLKPPEIMKDRELEIWFFSVPCNWKKMSNFAKTRGILSPNARNMLYKMGDFHEKGKSPSIAQLYYAKKIYEEFLSITFKLGYKSTYFANNWA